MGEGIKLIVFILVILLTVNIKTYADDIDIAIEKLKYIDLVSKDEDTRKNNELNIRCDAANYLGTVKAKKAIPTLLNMLIGPLKEKNPEIRLCVVLALMHINDKSTYPTMLKALKYERNKEVQLKLIVAMGQMGIKEAIPILEKRLKFPDPIVQDATIEAMGDLKYTKVKPQLIKKLKNIDEDKQVRRSIIQYLGKVGTLEDLPLLEKLANDKKEDPLVIQNAAKIAINDIKTRFKIKQ